LDQAQKPAEVESPPDNPFMRAMRDYFEAEGCVLLFYENANKTLVTKKEIGHGPEWRVTSGLEFTNGLLFSTFEANQIREFTGPTAGKDYFPRIDGVKDIIPQFIVCGPIQNHVRKFGMVALINPHNYFINTKDKIIFQLFLSSLAGQYYSSMIIKEMRAVDEDLHVSRLQLLNSRNALRSLFDSIPDSLYMVDENYRLKAVNLSRAKRVKKAPRDLGVRFVMKHFFGLSRPCEIV
jgi:PAS domain-containing protein